VSTFDALLSFVPGVVRQRVLAGEEPVAAVDHVEGVLLASDVSGFTQLALSLRDTPGGIEELSDILNGCFVRLIDSIDDAGGDVLTFAGDALIAYWPVGPDSGTSAAWAALEAQRRLAQGDHRIKLRIGLAVGPTAIATVGGEANRWFVTLGGTAPAEAAALQARAELGQVAVSDGFVELAGASIETSHEGGVHRLLAVERPPARPPDRASNNRSLDDSTLASLRRHVPGSVVDRLLAGHEGFLSELRTVTVALLATPGLEDPAKLDLLQDVVTTVQRCAYEYGGVVDPGVDEKGITFRIVFGMPPFAHEDDVDRALSTVRAIDRELTSRGVDHGIGVKTGQAFCGTLGNDIRREYAVLSEIVSMAARFAGAASEPGRPSVLCDTATADAARPRWTFETPMSLRLKGASELHTAFALSNRVRRAGLAAEAIVGRAAELEQICELLETASDRSGGGFVLVVGDPGIGKSSLLGAVQARLEETGRIVRVGFADPLERSAPFHAWSAVFSGLLGLDAVARDDIPDHLLRRVGPKAPLLSAVLAVDLPETEETASLGGEQRVVGTRTLLAELLAESRDERGSLVLLLEDAHWFDSASWGLVVEAVGLPGIAVVATARPTDENTARELARLEGRADVTQIPLGPLSADDVGELARARLGVEELDNKVQALLVETCKGNPFFTVEVVKTLAQRGALAVESGRATLADEQGLEIPTTIQAAITSRVDSLSAEQQLTLKVASVIGSPFSDDVLAEIHPTARPRSGLSEDLRSLAERELVVELEGGSYEFHHALTREVAYSLMMGDQRRGLHEALATHYESSTDLELLYPVLAHHWLRAENDEKAVSYLTLAAVSSLAHGMPRESVAQGVQAARLLGVELETEPSKITAVLPRELGEIERLLAGRRPPDLVALPPLVDEEIGAGIGIVLQSMPSAHQSLQTELFALMAIRNLNLTLRFGAGPLSPGVYSMYSIVLRGLGADSTVAYEFSELARTVDAANGDLLAPVVSFVHVWFNNHWHNPLATGIPIALAGAEAGLAGPDHLFGSFNLAAATTVLATSGAPLAEVMEMGQRHLERTRPRSATASFHNLLELQMAKALAGQTESLTSLSGDAADEEELAAMVDSANFNQAAYYHIAKLRLHYLAGEPSVALEYADRAYQLLPSFGGQVGQVELTVLAALSRLADLPADPALRDEALESVREMLAQLEAWSVSCPANFEHKANLVRGELAAAKGQSESADAALADAAGQAVAEGFHQWAALACERRGHAAQAAGFAEPAGEHFAAASQHYRAWGASAKVVELGALADALRSAGRVG
jgi:predicted ATPase/class 3 adenylate cyclase